MVQLTKKRRAHFRPGARFCPLRTLNVLLFVAPNKSRKAGRHQVDDQIERRLHDALLANLGF